MHVMMIAAENGAVPGGKVGGLGDVIRDIPPALATAGHDVSVLTPGYGHFVQPKRDTLVATIDVDFCGRRETIILYQLHLSSSLQDQLHSALGTVKHYALEHWLFSAGGRGEIYSDDDYGPFATDAYKFALFAVATCELIKTGCITDVDVLHCHDWHTAATLILRQYAEQYRGLSEIKTVYSIHNLSYQGIRPLKGNDSSLEHWFPDLKYNLETINDPEHDDCVNLMRAGINLADKVHTVSPSYAEEILHPSDVEHGFVGGEGLESDLQKASKNKKLFGILNGCDYENYTPRQPTKSTFWKLIDRSVDHWAKSQNAQLEAHHYCSYYYALRRFLKLSRQRKSVHPIFISVGRLTEQKLKLLAQPCGKLSTLEILLKRLHPGIFILLGTGDERYEQFLVSVMSKYKNFLFLCGFSEQLSDALYQFGDLFIMPSSFEPCGISQLLALRAGMPCLVHAIGGLKDTVIDGETGFAFSGDTEAEQIENLLQSVEKALDCFHNHTDSWQRMRDLAAQQRFTWESAAVQYVKLLYGNANNNRRLKIVAV